MPLRSVGVLGSVLLVAGVAIGVALAAPSTKNYDATIAQTGQQTYEFTLTNLQSSNQTLGSANLMLPNAFNLAAATVTEQPAGKSWTATPNGQTVELRAANKNSPLAPNESVTVQVTATAPCGADYEVGLRVKQSNNFSGPPGNDFHGPNPLLLDVVGPAASFELTAPSPQVVGVPFDATVTASDACGATAVYYGGSPTLGGNLEATGSSTPSYGSFTFTDGVGTAPATAVKSQQGATLTATDSSVSPALSDTSNEFDVVDTICRPGDQECRVSTGDTVVSAPPPEDEDATLALSLLRPGQQYTCGGTTAPAIGSFALIAPEGYAGGADGHPIPVTLQLTLPSGVGNPTLCLSTSKTFDADSFVVVPRCARTSPEPPCEQSRSRTGNTFMVTFLIKPEDPWAGAR